MPSLLVLLIIGILLLIKSHFYRIKNKRFRIKYLHFKIPGISELFINSSGESGLELGFSLQESPNKTPKIRSIEIFLSCLFGFNFINLMNKKSYGKDGLILRDRRLIPLILFSQVN